MTGLQNLMQSKRILFVLQYLAMGDAFLLSPVYKNLKDNVPGIKIDILTNKYAMPFLGFIPYVDGVFELEPLVKGKWRLLELLRLCVFFLKGRFDTIVLRADERMPQRAIETAAKICRLNVVLVGPHLKDEVNANRHIVETYLRILESAGLKITERNKLYVAVPDASVTDGKKFLKGDTKKLVGIAPVSNVNVKNWTPFRTAELIMRLTRESYRVLLFCNNDTFVKEVRGLLGSGVSGGQFDVIGIIDARLLTGIISLCKGFVGVDTGLTHLAAALGVPTVGLYGPTSSTIAGPYGPGNIALQKEKDCPYYRPMSLFSPGEKVQECYVEDRCMIGLTNCVEPIEVDEVMDAFFKLMKGAGY